MNEQHEQFRHHPGQHQAAQHQPAPATVPAPAPVDVAAYFPPMKTDADLQPANTGYLNRVLRLDFPSLTADPTADPVWVELRNPQLVHPGLLATDVALGADGMPISAAASLETMYEVISKLALDWRVYDATTDPREPSVLLGPPSFSTAARLPLAIINKLGELIQQASNPL